MRVEDRALAGVEGDEEVRLVDEVDAHLEVVADAAHTGLVPREVVAELELALLGRLWSVLIRANREAVREALVGRRAARRDVVFEVGVLEDELVQLRSA